MTACDRVLAAMQAGHTQLPAIAAAAGMPYSEARTAVRQLRDKDVVRVVRRGRPATYALNPRGGCLLQEIWTACNHLATSADRD